MTQGELVAREVESAMLEEELEEVDVKTMEADPHYQATVKRTLDGRTFTGTVTSIDKGAKTGTLLYLVEYNDGEMEHYTAEEVKKYLIEGKRGRAAPEGSDEEVVKPAKKAKKATKERAAPPAAVAPAVPARKGKVAAPVKGKAAEKKGKVAPTKGKVVKKVAMKAAPVKAMKAAPMKGMKAAPMKGMKAAPMKAMKAAPMKAMKAMKGK